MAERVPSPDRKPRTGRLFLVRHGESEGNLSPVLLGSRSDPPLTEAGRAQARAVGELLRGRDWQPSVIYASPLERARETGAILGSDTDAELTEIDALRELDFGELEGLNLRERPEALEPWHRDPAHHAFRDGESLDQVRRRIVRWSMSVWPDPDRDLVMVSHLFATMALLMDLLGLDLPDFRSFFLDPGGVVELRRIRGRVHLCGLYPNRVLRTPFAGPQGGGAR